MLKYSSFKWIIGISTGLTAVALPVGLCIQKTQEIKKLNKDIQDMNETIKWKDEEFETATNLLDKEIKDLREELRKSNNDMTARKFASLFIKQCFNKVNEMANANYYIRNWWSKLIQKFQSFTDQLQKLE